MRLSRVCRFVTATFAAVAVPVAVSAAEPSVVMVVELPAGETRTTLFRASDGCNDVSSPLGPMILSMARFAISPANTRERSAAGADGAAISAKSA